MPQETGIARQTRRPILSLEAIQQTCAVAGVHPPDYEKEWGKDCVRPGLGTRILSTLLRYMPKIGPFKGLAFNNPTPQTEDLYVKSINTTVDEYRGLLKQINTGTLVLPNCDFDSGQATKAAEYSLTDETNAKLLARVSERKFDLMTPELRENILQFYSDLSVPIETKKDQVRWQGVVTALDQLKAVVPEPVVLGSPAQ